MAMMRELRISLTGKAAEIVSAGVRSGAYGSADEVVDAALHLLAREDRHLGGLRAAWAAGIESGDGGDLDFGALRAAARAELESGRR